MPLVRAGARFEALSVWALFLMVSVAAAQEFPDGKLVYQRHCAVCHGEKGDGQGPAAAKLSVKPRDFRPGVFKFRSTPTGSLPLDEDLGRTLLHGARGTGMVHQRHLSEAERRAVIAYMKTLSSRFTEEKPEEPFVVPPPPPPTPEIVARGQEIYRKGKCHECHGPEGRGDGPSAPRLKDDQGVPIKPTDLTRRPFKRGSDPAQTYLTIAAGLDGTPMPSSADAFDPAELWALVRYLDSLVSPERWAREDQLLPGEETLGFQIEEEQRRSQP